jgi:RNA polymerase sigma-70 factor (ECF subfamily)
MRVQVTVREDAGRPARRPAAPARPADQVEELWVRFSEELQRFIQRRVARHEDAEDILQSVFARIQGRISTLRDDERLLGWIYSLTRNAITDHYRRASNRREFAFDVVPDNELPGAGDPDEGPEAELSACLRPMLALIPTEQARALGMVELDGISQVEAARRAGISVSGMKSRVQRGRANLRDRLLACCAVEQDRRGRVRDYTPNVPECDGCRP